MIGVIILALFITYGCWVLWDYANTWLFTEVIIEIDGEQHEGYSYEALTIPARIVAFLCGVAAIVAFWLTWFSVYGIIFM